MPNKKQVILYLSCEFIHSTGSECGWDTLIMIPFKQSGILLACLFLVILDNSATGEDTQKENEKVGSVINYLNENPNSTYIHKEGQYVASQSKVRIYFKY